jgi:hypothetical protein
MDSFGRNVQTHVQETGIETRRITEARLAELRPECLTTPGRSKGDDAEKLAAQVSLFGRLTAQAGPEESSMKLVLHPGSPGTGLLGGG